MRATTPAFIPPATSDVAIAAIGPWRDPGSSQQHPTFGVILMPPWPSAQSLSIFWMMACLPGSLGAILVAYSSAMPGWDASQENLRGGEAGGRGVSVLVGCVLQLWCWRHCLADTEILY